MTNRIYHIRLKGTQRSWVTTSCISAMTFVMIFGLNDGFGLFSEPYSGPEIKEIQTNY